MRTVILAVVLIFPAFQGQTLAQELRVGATIKVNTPDPLVPVSGGVGTPKKTPERRVTFLADSDEVFVK